MVSSGDQQGEETQDAKTPEERFSMEVGSGRSRNLHYFNLPELKWGDQKQLRCVNVDDDGSAKFRAPDRRSKPATIKNYSDATGPSRKTREPEKKRQSLLESEIGEKSTVDSDGNDEFEAVRKSIMLDLQKEMHNMKFTVMSKDKNKIEPTEAKKTEAPPVDEARPWNLRTRRAVYKEPNTSGGGGAKNQRIDEGNYNFSPARGSMKSPTRWNDAGGGEYSGARSQKQRPLFTFALSKQEIEEDLIAMTGRRPARKPKRRPKAVQKQLDTLFPGLWLSEITPEMYKVNENPEPGKKK